MGYVAGSPGPECGVQPGERQDGEERAGYFVEKLFEGAPEAAETLLRRGFGGADGCGHVDSLAHNRRHATVGAQHCFTLRLEGCAPACPGFRFWCRRYLNERAVNTLETTVARSLVSNLT
jgi:hypothetical protein